MSFFHTKFLLKILVCIQCSGVFGHGGGLDSKGCHHDRRMVAIIAIEAHTRLPAHPEPIPQTY